MAPTLVLSASLPLEVVELTDLAMEAMAGQGQGALARTAHQAQEYPVRVTTVDRVLEQLASLIAAVVVEVVLAQPAALLPANPHQELVAPAWLLVSLVQKLLTQEEETVERLLELSPVPPALLTGATAAVVVKA
jgi:hypothetical protein